ncbi:MAG: flagellar hook-basal body complex protein FliE [Gammaproteobacteria bacterium]|nr:flagellar hook-basal body complex protein FliE [Gammaproteobacteria bacterium]
MNIESLSSVASEALTTNVGSKMQEDVSDVSFSNMITEYYNDVNSKITEADNNLRDYAVGDNTNIHELLISIQKAKSTFELGLQVRNRLLEGYQEVMRMQM